MKPIILCLLFLLLTTTVLATNATNTTSVCGDNICGAGENPKTCPSDCRITMLDYAVCAFDDSQALCLDNDMKEKSQQVIIIVGAGLILLYLKLKDFI